MAPKVPKDKYYAVWLIFFMLGLGTLLPWNFFMTATVYFTGRLKEPMGANVSANGTAGDADPRGVLEAMFNNVMTLCSMVPLLVFTCLNSFLHGLVPQKLRVAGSLVVILLVFCVTATIVRVTMPPLPFFIITMTKIAIINSFGAILQGSLFGMAGLLPPSYTTPIMSGQGLAGTFAALAMICAIASGSEIQDVAVGYFITAAAVVLLSILSYVALPKMEFYQHYQESNAPKQPGDIEHTNDLIKNEKSGDSGPMEQDITLKVSVIAIFKKIWVVALAVCFVFTVSISVFPAVTADVRSTIANAGAWELYFTPVTCFLLFNLCDWAGRSLTALCTWPGKDSVVLPVLVVGRVVFVPLFMMCNVQPRAALTGLFFHHDAWFLLFMVAFAFSNGYLASLCMCYGPTKVLPHEAETAGAIMALFLTLGLALGASFSFLFRGMI